MSMTHYMHLLATNQPRNLIIYMAIPVILAETVAITELFILFNREGYPTLKKINKIAGIAGGIWFLGIFFYLLFTAAIPFTTNGEWYGPIDVISVVFYLLGVIPLLGITLLDLKIIGKSKTEDERLKLHATFVGIFLVVAHVAMIFGMLDPAIFSSSDHSGMKM